MRRTILVDLSDTHAGHKLGLMNPAVTIKEEDEFGNLEAQSPKPTAWQEYLWELYQTNIDQVLALAGKDEIVVIHNGDLAQGIKYPQQLVSTNLANQILIAEANLAPWLMLPNVRSMRFVIGTGAHEFGEGAATMLVVNTLSNRFPAANIQALYHGLASVDDVTIDYAHHGPHPGGRDWLRGNVARFYLRDLMTREIKAGRRPPDLVLRAHYHQYIRETLETDGYVSTLVITPSYCALTDHGHQATQSANEITNGLVAFEIVSGKLLDIHRFFQTVDIRTRETL